MTIRNIRFTSYTTVSNCESEPIHVPGSIQPFGVLLAVNIHTYTVDFCSANTGEFLGLPASDVLGKALKDIVGVDQWKNLHQHIKENNPEQIYILTYNSVLYDISSYRQGDLVLLEIERSAQTGVSLPDLFEQSKNFVSYLGKSDSLQGLCTHVAEQVRMVTGYDRVMIYRFDKEYNGEVYAESLNDNVESFFGLHYPHTDIPPQARALFARNLLRMIPDVYYQPVGVVTTKENATHESLDMSVGGLRSVSPVHIEYLKNMGVGASLTVSLIHNQKLWGLIACHHNTPKLLPATSRLSAKLHAHFLTSQISNRESAREHKATMDINEQLGPIIKSISKNDIGHYRDNKQLYECINADGIAILTDSLIYLAGKTPDKKQIMDLVDWLDYRTESDYYATSRLAGSYPQAADIKDTASGVFFHSLNKGSKQGVLWFRSEKKRTVLWAGDPDKVNQSDAAKLLPRKSFAVWQQIVAGTCDEWESPEIYGGIRLATNIQNNVFLGHITREEKKYRLQTYKLEKLNEELSNFNYICSHDLQEPIRKIQVFSSMLLSDKKPAPGFEKEHILNKINVSAHRAVAMINDLLELASVSNYSDVLDEVNLDDCLSSVLTDLELVIEEKHATITHEYLGNVKAIRTQIERLLYNLIANSLKFSNATSPEITIELGHATADEIMHDTPLDPQAHYVCLKVSDNGIGFEQEYAHKIFSVFYRLDNKQMYEGRGIGLAICKKIADNHQGYIRAKSEKDKGATFYVYLKC
jgi:light-regulated signal transduction histidine kinase (bacteriophytochrome)